MGNKEFVKLLKDAAIAYLEDILRYFNVGHNIDGTFNYLKALAHYGKWKILKKEIEKLNLYQPELVMDKVEELLYGSKNQIKKNKNMLYLCSRIMEKISYTEKIDERIKNCLLNLVEQDDAFIRYNAYMLMLRNNFLSLDDLIKKETGFCFEKGDNIKNINKEIIIEEKIISALNSSSEFFTNDQIKGDINFSLILKTEKFLRRIDFQYNIHSNLKYLLSLQNLGEEKKLGEEIKNFVNYQHDVIPLILTGKGIFPTSETTEAPSQKVINLGLNILLALEPEKIKETGKEHLAKCLKLLEDYTENPMIKLKANYLLIKHNIYKEWDQQREIRDKITALSVSGYGDEIQKLAELYLAEIDYILANRNF